MKGVKNILSFLWRIWFLLTFAIPFALFMPLTIFLTLSPKLYPILYRFLHPLSTFMMYGSGIIPVVKKEAKLDPKKQYIFCPNHPSTLDIPMMFYTSKKPVSFIGKSSLGKIPIFGYYYRRFNVLVDRSSRKNSYLAYQQSGQQLKEGKNMVIFPEGGIPKEEVRLARFKNGPFRLAVEQQVSIIPVTFADNKRIFPGESFFKGGPRTARITIHPEVTVEGMTEADIPRLKEQLYSTIEAELIRYENESK
jgi:1-acyl-sn-glycerol-3-phosphate acyltransferase